LKSSTVMDISVFEGVFGLKSRIFIRNYKLSISNYECDHLHFFNLRLSTWTYLFFSRRSTLIFFSLIHADLFSAPICDFNLRISAWTVFSEFSHPRPNIPQNYSLLKIRGVPPKTGRCYDVMKNWEFKKLEMRILNYKFSFCLFFLVGVDIRLCNCNRSAFQAAYGCCIFVRRSVTRGYQGYCLSGKG
jgi:hypothetical protein